ncbi:MAG: hypothetical protein LBO67_04170 [Spirochaetaceae bacterium]|nr:hypothetical protein [Spirochaetaceae bacterium]
MLERSRGLSSISDVNLRGYGAGSKTIRARAAGAGFGGPETPRSLGDEKHAPLALNRNRNAPERGFL